MRKSLKILLADDSEIVRRGIRDLVRSRLQEWSVCGEVAERDQIIPRIGELKPDVVLLDLSMVRLSGIGFVKTLNEMFPRTAIVIMSEQEPSVLRHMAESLAFGHFISKSMLGSHLIPQLEAISRTPNSR
jgi:NarL family two-component system response regulator YdfI